MEGGDSVCVLLGAALEEESDEEVVMAVVDVDVVVSLATCVVVVEESWVAEVESSILNASTP